MNGEYMDNDHMLLHILLYCKEKCIDELQKEDDKNMCDDEPI